MAARVREYLHDRQQGGPQRQSWELQAAAAGYDAADLAVLFGVSQP